MNFLTKINNIVTKQFIFSKILDLHIFRYDNVDNVQATQKNINLTGRSKIVWNAWKIIARTK